LSSFISCSGYDLGIGQEKVGTFKHRDCIIPRLY